MQVVVYTTSGGQTGVIYPTEEFVAQFPNTAAALAAIQARDVPASAVAISVLSSTSLPPREFREAWESTGGNIKIDMTKARSVFDGRLQEARLKKAQELNERETVGEDVAADKVWLAGLSVASSNAATPEALSALWPPGLDKP